MALCMVIVVLANVAVFGALGYQAVSGALLLDRFVVFAQVALGVSLIAFGGLNWALDGAAAPVAAVARLGPAMAPLGALPLGAEPAAGQPAREIALRDVTFSYPGTARPVFAGLDLTVPAGTSLAIVGQNGAGKTTLAKLLCRLYDPDAGAIEVDGIDLRRLDLARLAQPGHGRVPGLRPLRAVAAGQRRAGRAADDATCGPPSPTPARATWPTSTRLAKGYPGGTDLSGGQWQRVALARALVRRRRGAGLVLLDEPTAQLDVRGEAAIFERVLAATRDGTTILISHRFSTVRQADRICVLEHGRVIELGSHDQLMLPAAGTGRCSTCRPSGSTRTMDEEGVAFDVL